MEALETYLRETGTSADDFAKLIGVDADAFDMMLEGTAPIEACIARRMVDATGGALQLDDLAGEEADSAASVIDFRAQFASSDAAVDAGRLEDVLKASLPSLLGGARRAGDEYLPRLAAEAAAATYIALSTITSRSGADRLAQALQPVFSEILEEMAAPSSRHRLIAAQALAAAELYFQETQQKRRA